MRIGFVLNNILGLFCSDLYSCFGIFLIKLLSFGYWFYLRVYSIVIADPIGNHPLENVGAETIPNQVRAWLGMTYSYDQHDVGDWIPAFAGMTKQQRNDKTVRE